MTSAEKFIKIYSISNYNRITRPPVVLLKDGSDYIAVRRESLEDLVRNDM